MTSLTLSCQDWHHAPEGQVLPLYRDEIERWASVLEWDAESNWREVERGRRLGTVRGALVTDSRGDVVGWCYFLRYERALQVGGFVSPSNACTSVMLDWILCPDALVDVDTVTLFALAQAPGLTKGLRQRGVQVSRYWYLTRDAIRGPAYGTPRGVRPWCAGDASATAELLMNAYTSPDPSRPFAPRGTRSEWETYVAQLVTAPGCGTLLAGPSLCVPAGSGRLSAVALVSQIAPSTGHLVQLAVDPRVRRRGLGAALLDAACRSAARQGCRRITLMVNGRNRAARHLYADAGFVPATSFVSGGALHPRRSTSVAPGASVMTLR